MPTGRHRESRTKLAALLTLIGLLLVTLILGTLLAYGLLMVFSDPARAAAVTARASVNRPAVARVQSPVRVTTYNTYFRRPADSMHRDIARVAQGTDVLAMQETSRATTYLPGWSGFRPGGTAAPRPIIWRTARFRLLASGTAFAQLHPWHRRNTWVRLADKATGATLTVVNHHAASRVERNNGHPRFPRARNYANAMRRMVELVRSLPGPLVVAGDWNVDRQGDARVRWYGFPARMASRTGMVADASATGTRYRRTIDYAFHRGGLSRAGIYVGARGGSDHRPVTVTYRLH